MLKLKKQEVIGEQSAFRYGAKGIPFSDTGVVAVSTGAKMGARPPALRFRLGPSVLGAPSICRVSGVWVATFLLYFVCSMFATLLRVRSISRITLEELFGMVRQGKGQYTHLSETSSAILTDSSRSSVFFPLITVFTASHMLKQYSDSRTESLLSIILSLLGR